MTFVRENTCFTDYTLIGYELDPITHFDDLGRHIDRIESVQKTF